MSFSDLLTQTGHVWRRPAPTYRNGVPTYPEPVLLSTFACRLSWQSGSETVTAVSDQRSQERKARIFADPGLGVVRSDEVSVDGVSARFEVEFSREIRDATGLHHTEIDVSVVEGD